MFVAHRLRKFCFIITCALIILIYTCMVWPPGESYTFDKELSYYEQDDYLIFNNKCRIINLNPWNPDARGLYIKNPPYKCSNLEDLTDVIVSDNGTVVEMIINETRIPLYSRMDITCCVRTISRKRTRHMFNDNEIKTGKCEVFYPFVDRIQLSASNPSFVACKNYLGHSVYSNVHMPIVATPAIVEKISKFQLKRPLSVLFIGIDSVSRLNMMRTMPLTRAMLAADSDWLEYKVYQKMGDNTFPNLMAILTGYNREQAYQKCKPKQADGLDSCPFIWKEYSSRNYVTMYSEDLAKISTFNYEVPGFNEQPTDYYTRPYHLACAHLLREVDVDYSPFCTGTVADGERVLRLIQDFIKLHRNNAYFGFFWMNGFSHENVNLPTRMDESVKDYLKNITSIADENSVIIFLSDHGMRFGPIRNSLTGYLEERLPFLYMKFPKWFQAAYPIAYSNLKINTERMVTPFDMHMTIQNILKHSDETYKIKPSKGCPKCHSLMEPIEFDRSCEDANITEHWCTCSQIKPIGKEEQSLAENAAHAAIFKLNFLLSKVDTEQICEEFAFSHLIRAFHASDISKQSHNLLVVLFATNPRATFEATVQADTMEVYSGISRSDTYKISSVCTNDKNLKPYCYCKDKNITKNNVI